MRLSLAPLALLVALPAIAHAGDINGGTPAIEIRLPTASGDSFEYVAPGRDDRRFEHQFNQAACLCGADGIADERTQFAAHLTWTTQPQTPVTSSIDLWTGIGCDTATGTSRDDACGTSAKASTTSEAIQQAVDVPLSTIDLVDAKVSDPRRCDPTEADHFVYVVYNPSGSSTFDAAFPSDPIPTDTKLPTAPAKFTLAAGGEGALTLEWPAVDSSAGVYYWQALCAKVDATAASGYAPAFATPPVDARFETAAHLCNDATQPSVTVVPTDVTDPGTVDAGVTDAGATGLPDALAALDPAYVCGEQGQGATKMRIEGLENGAQYYVVLVAVDEAGNPAGITPGFTLSPQPATDFWEDLHDQGSDAQGGFCLIADTYGEGGGPGGAITVALRDFRDHTLASSSLGRAITRFYYAHIAGAGALARHSAIARAVLAVALLPLVAVALAWQLLTLPGLLAAIAAIAWWRRRRRTAAPRLALATAGAAIALLAGGRAASAQSFTPYWDDQHDVTHTAGPEAVKWHVGLKMGPYVPQIDAQLGFAEGAGPYHQFYGGYNILPVLEVDRVLWAPAGSQLAAGVSLGVLGKTGQALDANGQPSSGDQTKFRLMPLAANVLYRFTMLDDEYGVPVVPYLRGGLAYYVWWITQPNGDVAVVDTDNKARGATLGLVGSAGLALRAEKLDPGAASSMRDSGIYHIGFFGEYQVGWVDGFGKAGKLAVGDRTWFAGVDFEF